MRAGVITFPGSNCDDDCIFALRTACEFQVDRLWHKDTPDLSVYDLVVLPGGFSYGDYLRCGAIAALSPIIAEVKKFAASGKLVMGTCNGFQILCETGLLPGALARNEKLNFVCKDITLKVESTSSPWLSGSELGEILTLPIAHGDGRYIISDEEYALLRKNEQILLTYSAKSPKATAEEKAAANPNGSAHAIAGICNATRNVFGLMPHPERATDLRSKDGLKIWQSITRHLRESKA